MSVGYGAEGERFAFAAALILVGRFTGLASAAVRLLWLTPGAAKVSAQAATRSRGLGLLSRKELGACLLCSLSSATNSVSSLCQYGALSMGVSFPLVCLFKSTRTISLIVIGSLFFARQHSREDCAVAACVAAGVSLSMLSSSSSSSSSSPPSPSSSSSSSSSSSLPSPPASLLLGSLLLCVYSVADAITSLWQSRIFKTHGPLSPALVQCSVNLWSLVLLSLRLFAGARSAAVSKEVEPMLPTASGGAVSFATRHPEVLVHALVLVACSAVSGQFWIFRTLQRHGPLALSCAMVVRQQLSVLASFLVFGTRGREAVLGPWCLAGFVLVFGALWFKVVRASRRVSVEVEAVPVEKRV